jgi:cyanophycin synthetase
MTKHSKNRRRGPNLSEVGAPVTINAFRPLLGRHRQCVRIRKFKFRAPENAKLVNLNAWRPFFDDETLQCERFELSREFSPEVFSSATWFEHILALTRHALLAVNIPCFEHIYLLKCTLTSRRQNVYEAVIAMPELDSYGANSFHTALKSAMSCAYYLQDNPPDDAILERQFQKIDGELLAELRKGTVHSDISLRVLHTAYCMGVPFWNLGVGVNQLGWGASSKLIDRSTTTNDSPMSNKLTKFKHVTANILRSAGLPVPKHALVSNLSAAKKFGESVGWPVVVKPADLERGEGVQVDVGLENLESALNSALRISTLNRALVEQQVKGVCHRLFVSRGELLYAVKRLPIGVYGDGVRSIASLVDIEIAKQRRKPIWLRSKPPPMDGLGKGALAAAGFTEASVPKSGEFVPLRRIESTEWGGVDEDVSGSVHPENLRIALVAAELCGLDVAGIDIITEDISIPWVKNGAIINEVNYAPSLGAGEISRRHLNEYVRRLVGESARIPVNVFVGDEGALEAAKAHLKEVSSSGKAIYLTDDAYTLGPLGQEIPTTAVGLRGRVRAMLLNRNVEALVIVLQTDSILEDGLPLEGVDAVHVVGEPSLSSGSDAPAERRRQLEKLLAQWIWQ